VNLAPLNGTLTPMLGLREPVSGLMHLGAAVLAIYGTLLLVARSREEPRKQIALGLYGLSMIALLSASAAYHLATLAPDRLAILRRIDHASIFVLIAGTFTPFCACVLEGRFSRLSLIGIWTVAFAGIVAKLAYMDMPDSVSSGLYVAMGWLAVLGYSQIAAALSHRAMALLFVGGVLYTVGGVVDALRWPVFWPGVFGFHENLHLLVVIAGLIHYLVIHAYVVPYRREAAVPVEVELEAVA
jgi:hemolysin III